MRGGDKMHFSDPNKKGYSLCKAEDPRDDVALVCYSTKEDVTCKRCLKILEKMEKK